MALLGIAYEGVVVEERLPFLKLRLRTGGYAHVRAQKGLGVGDRVKFYYEPRHGMIAEVLTITEWEEEERIRQAEITHAVKELQLRDGSCDEVLPDETDGLGFIVDNTDAFHRSIPRLEEGAEPGDYDM
jgi:hypothetical protein